MPLARSIAVVLLGIAFSATSTAEEKAAFVHKIKPGDVPPAMLGISRGGDDVKTTDFAGKVLVTTFWASWCAPCRAEMDALEKIQRIAKDNLQVVAVNIEDRDTFRKVTRPLHDWQMILANDQYKRHADTYGVKGIPHMLIIGRDGKVLKVHRGYNETFLKTLIEDVIAALDK